MSESVHMCVRVSVSMAVGRLAAQKGEWAAASVRVARRASARNVPSPPLDPSQMGVSSLGRKKEGSSVSQAHLRAPAPLAQG